MYIGINISADHGSESKSDCIIKVSEIMKSYFKNKHYGAINYYLILCEAAKTIPGFEKFSTIPRPMYKEKRRFLRFDGTREELKGVYTCGFKIDFEEYDKFVTATDEEAEQMIARKVVDSLSYLDRLSKKAAAFDKDRFKSDMIQLFKENNLI